MPTLRHHAQHGFERPQFADLPHLVAEILQRELVLDELALHLDGLLLVDGLLGLLDEARACRPCPECAMAARSGWKGSKASNFSPTPTNFSGCPVTCRIESAAPPRASPSILVRMTPVMPSRLWNSSADLHRVLSGHGVGHEQDLDRVEQLFQLLQLGHEIIVDVQAAGGIHQQHVAPGVGGLAPRRPRQIERRCFFRRALDRSAA